MDRALLQRLNAARADRCAVVLVRALDAGVDTLVAPGDPLPADVPAEVIATAFRSGKSRSIETDAGPVFVAPYLPPPKLVIIGAVHISQALAPMAVAVGLDPVIVDPRTAFATEERFPDVPVHAEWPDEVLPEIGLDAYTALAALTHDPKIDDPALTAALNADCFYIGALGSRKTHAKREARLAEAGFTADAMARIHAPIGLPIHAASPAEIAVAVLAEVIEALRGPKS